MNRVGPNTCPPKVSIGMPVHNGASFIEAALDSLLAQSFDDFELIVSDNASDDETPEICRRYAARDTRVRYVRQSQNIGAVPNFNAVFELSRGTYFKWAAYDDVCLPTLLERLVALLDAAPDVAWCHSRSSHMDANGALLADARALDVSYAARAEGSAARRFAAVLMGGEGCLDSYGLIRSAALRRTKLYPSVYGAEKVLVAELALIGRYAEVDETLFLARVTGEGSGALATAEEQQAFIDPKAAASVTRLRILKAYLDAIVRSAPDRQQAWAARLALLRWLAQASKWRRVMETALRGRGVGGGNVARLERLERTSSPRTGQDDEIQGNEIQGARTS